MSKKNFSMGLDSLITNSKPKPDKKKKAAKDAKGKTRSTKKNTPKAETRSLRATFIVREDLLASAKAYAYWERKLIKDVINEALDEYLSSKGKIKDIPKGDK